MEMGNESCYEIEGTAVVVADYLSRAMNFSYSFHFTDFNYGIELANGSWIGNLANLFYKRVNMMMSTVYLTERRNVVFWPTHVIDIMSTQILSTSQYVGFTNFTDFIDILQNEVWTIFCLFLLISVFLTATTFKYRPRRMGPKLAFGDYDVSHITNSIGIHVRSIFQTSIASRRIFDGIRLNFGLWILGTFVIMKTLSGSVQSILVQERELYIINRIEDLLPITNLKLFVPDGDDWTILKETINHKKLLNIRSRFEQTFRSYDCKFKKLLDPQLYRDIWKGEVAAFYRKTFLQSFLGSQCGTFYGNKRFVFSEDSYFPMPIVFLVRRDFPAEQYRKLNNCILRLQEQHIILRHYKIMLKNYKKCRYVRERRESTVLGWRHLHTTFQMVGYLLLISSIVLCLEIVVNFLSTTRSLKETKKTTRNDEKLTRMFSKATSPWEMKKFDVIPLNYKKVIKLY